MTKDQLLKKVKVKIATEFSTKKEAADYFGITSVKLSQVLSAEAVHVPEKILDWIGYELAEPNYIKKKVKKK